MVELFELLKRSILEPRAAARQVIGMGLGRQTLWMGLVLVALLNAIVYAVTFRLGGAGADLPADLTPEEQAMIGFYTGMAEQPFLLTGLLTVALILSVFFLYHVGRWLGGKGAFDDLLAVMTLWQFVGFAISLAVLLVGVVALPVASLLSFFVNIWLLYVLCAMLAEAHGFSTPLAGLGTLVLAVLLMAVLLSVLLVLAGVGSGLGVSNV